jgi:hypothetical protein
LTGTVAVVDEGLPSSWEALEPGTAVHASDGTQVGEVKEVLAVPEKDIFEGLVVKTGQGDRFAHADTIASIHEHGVALKLDAAAAAQLPPPDPAPAAMSLTPDDTAETSGAYKRDIWFRRLWDRLSGKY